MPHKILVVDDEERMRELLELHLKGVFRVDTAASGDEALKLLADETYDLVVLDVLMPDRDGWDVCADIRNRFEIPVLMLTALSGVEEKLEAFSVGADDYMTKPFDARELIARVKALLRRSDRDLGHNTLRFSSSDSGLVIDPLKRTVTKDSEILHLTPMEFDLLHHLATQPDRVFTREDLLLDVWKDEGYVETRTVDSHIKTLREKLGRDDWGKSLVTVWGTGYKFVPTIDTPWPETH